MAFNTYIDDKDMIPYLLAYDWMISHDTWTDCPFETYQAITLFGAGDPKTMASGISKALMTTVLGLVVAIPTTLLHAIVSSQSKGIIHIIEEQSAGIIARHAEGSGRPIS